jgi:hypothetical protein
MGSSAAADEPALFQFGAVTVSFIFFYFALKLILFLPRLNRMR